jgi:hypothetical protein
VTATRRHGLRLVVGLLAVALIVVVARETAALASPTEPAAPSTPAAPPAPAAPVDLGPGPPPSPDCVKHWPTFIHLPPWGYTWDCPSGSAVKLKCTEENAFLGWDDDTEVWVPSDTPDWWRNEVTGDQNGCELAKHPPQKPCSVHRDAVKQAAREGRIVSPYIDGSLIPDGCWGTYPTRNYKLSWEEGNLLNPGSWGDSLIGMLIALSFTVARSIIQIALWMVGWGFTFDIMKYSGFMSEISSRYQVNLVWTWNLENIVWFVLVGYMGFVTLRGKIGKAGGELVMAIVLSGLCLVLFNHRTMYMRAVTNFMDKGTIDLMAASIGDGEHPPATVAEALAPLQQRIHEEFVETPYTLLNWGAPSKTECITTQSRILAVGWDDDGWGTRFMRRVGCPDQVGQNADPTDDRLLGSLMALAIDAVVGSFLALSAFTVVIAKFLLALMFAVTPFLVVIAVLPGAGRRMVWAWVGTLIQLVLMVLGMSFLMALLMLGIQRVLVLTPGGNTMERWFVVLLIVSTIYFTRKKLLASGQTAATTVADRLTRLSPAAAGWTGGGTVGFDFDRPDRAATRAAKGTAIAAGTGAAIVASGLANQVSMRLAERRTARRGMANLEAMERSRERPQIEWRKDSYYYSPKAAAQLGGGKKGKAGKAGKVGPDPRDGEWRIRRQVRMNTRAPRGFLRHPIGHFQDRSRMSAGFVGTKAQLRREVRRADRQYQRKYIPLTRHIPFVKNGIPRPRPIKGRDGWHGWS